jgi:hypothetical protein
MSLYSKKNNNYGVNTSVELDPNAVSQSTVENKIIINTSRSENDEDSRTPYACIERSADIVPTVLANPVLEISNAVEAKLLKIFTEILLSQNKTLLTNILSKSSIILSKPDLESVISTKVSHPCMIQLEDKDGNGCCVKLNPLHKIFMIKITLNDTEVDFKYVFNAEYCCLQDQYHLSMKYVI